jgi:hypothetical protein
MSDIKIYKSDIRDFIGIFDTDFDCQSMINTFNTLQETNKTFIRNYARDEKETEDEAYYCHPAHPKNFGGESYEIDVAILGEYNELMNACFEIYGDTYTALKKMASFQWSVNIQKTKPGQGYHAWHCERCNILSSGRHLTTMVYLNDVLDGGETEFLYQSRRIKPRAGRVVIFPVEWTHTHRGNPPLSGDKYIMTSWLYHRNP